MRSNAVAGLILLVLGLLALSIHSFSYFTTDQVVGPMGFFAWDVARPHTIFFNPIAGIVAMGIGAALLLVGRRRSV